MFDSFSEGSVYPGRTLVVLVATVVLAVLARVL